MQKSSIFASALLSPLPLSGGSGAPPPSFASLPDGGLSARLSSLPSLWSLLSLWSLPSPSPSKGALP
jgi:hypothetical protein